MKKIISLLLVLSLATVLPACSRDLPPEENKETTITENDPVPHAEQPAAAPDYPLYLPLPYYGTFYEEPILSGNIDAFLHNSTVDYYSTRVDAKSGHLLIPSLRLIDEWDAGDGATYYLCFAAYLDYYDLAETLMAGDTYKDPAYDGSDFFLGGLIRFKVTSFPLDEGSVQNFWGFQETEILESPPWGTNGEHIRTLCGDRPIAQTLLDAENRPGGYSSDFPYIRDILPSEYAHSKTALLEVYLEHYFPNLPK